MSHLVKIAAFQGPSVPFAELGMSPGDARAHDFVLAATRKRLAQIQDRDLDLVVTSEGIEWYGQYEQPGESLDRPGPYLQMYMDFARSVKCHVAGSCKIREGVAVYNSLIIIGPDGAILGRYDKTFLPPKSGSEIDRGYASGKGAVVVDTAIGRIGCAICFDLNFESLRKEYARLKPDIMAFASAYHGGLMQAVWAYECRCFFVAALVVQDGGILDPFGRPVARASEYTRWPMAQVNLDYVMVHVDENGRRFHEIRRKYGDSVTIDVPAHVGSAMISSNSSQLSALDVVKEFDLELLDDYFARSVKANEDNRPR